MIRMYFYFFMHFATKNKEIKFTTHCLFKAGYASEKYI